MQEIEILPDASALESRACDCFVRLAEKAIHARDRFTVALAGGSTPKRVYTLLARAQLDWYRIEVFWGDERCVPPDHEDSNYRMAAETLLDQISIPPENVHRILGELPAIEAARHYEVELRHVFGTPLSRFDLILLGLGSDGHTASLFPGSPVIHEEIRWASPVLLDPPPTPFVDRVTLTPPVINSAIDVIFLVSGTEKADILARVMQNVRRPDLLPAQVVSPVDGRLLWLLDRSAAQGIAPL